MRSIADHDLAAARSTSRRDLLRLSSVLGLSLGFGLAPGLAAAARPSASFAVRRAQVRANGALFHVIEQGRGPAILFCHGFPDTAETWRSQMQAVAAAGYRAVALDMRGYGASYAPAEVELYSAPHTVGDLVGVLDALRIGSTLSAKQLSQSDVRTRQIGSTVHRAAQST